MPPRKPSIVGPTLVVAGDPLLTAPAQKIEVAQTIDDDGPFTLDYDPQVLPDDQWVIEGVSALYSVNVAPADDRWKPPVSGLYLCPRGTEPETVQSSQFDLNLRTRPVPIPQDPYTAFRQFASSGINAGAIQMVGQSGFQVSVPGGWFLRAVLVTRPGTNTPGPGPGSYGRLTAVVRIIRKADVVRQAQINLGLS